MSSPYHSPYGGADGKPPGSGANPPVVGASASASGYSSSQSHLNYGSKKNGAATAPSYGSPRTTPSAPYTPTSPYHHSQLSHSQPSSYATPPSHYGTPTSSSHRVSPYPPVEYHTPVSTGAAAAAATTAAAAAAVADGGLRRRTTVMTGGGVGGGYASSPYGSNGRSTVSPSPVKLVKNLDFMFPKVDKEFTVQTQSGGIATVIAYGLVMILVLAETVTWMGQNRQTLEHILVDTSLGKRMRVNMNITFPELACDDLHLDAIDVAGDSQLNVEDTLKKKQIHLDGTPFRKEEIDVELNKHAEEQARKERLLKQELPADYCGPCFGAQETPEQCCQTCDEVLMAYSKKRWKSDLLKFTAEQCIREGRDKAEPKKMTKGQGCNLSGYMTVNRVSGNFHIAMGEGIERDGRHIHTFLPEDAPNFNASHIIHQLSFGPEDGSEPLNGVTKIVTENTGTTGLFQYFIKVVPTTYVGENVIPKVMSGVQPPYLDFPCPCDGLPDTQSLMVETVP